MAVAYKRLTVLALTAVLLSSCAPVISASQGIKSSLTRGEGNTVVFAERDGVLAERVVVALDGPTKVTGASCGAPEQAITICRLGNVKANNAVKLTYEGTLRGANASWYSANKLRATVTP